MKRGSDRPRRPLWFDLLRVATFVAAGAELVSSVISPRPELALIALGIGFFAWAAIIVYDLIRRWGS